MSDLVRCPKCHGDDVNITGDATTEHKPLEHNWWGQQHIVSIPMLCECGHEFIYQVSGYKNRVTVSGGGCDKCDTCGKDIHRVPADGKCDSCFYFPSAKP